MKQNMKNYTTEDFKVWKLLFDRQIENLKVKGSKDYLAALNLMQPVLHGNDIPEFKKMNHWFETQTGWNIEVVPGLIPVEEFFELLSQKRFCSSTWLRSLKNLDYLEEPDMFHDTFGHIPLLANPVFSEFVYEFGKLGKAIIHNTEKLAQLQRLYWFTIEFGVIKENGVLKSYGAGVISSFGETNQIYNQEANFFPFDIQTIFNKPFRTDVMQEDYFVIESLEQLFTSLEEVKQLLRAETVVVNH
ncbi:phenylalanine-4-hydroxylase [uncultured Planktosalinus sp.]|uniref:phenylalanine-4-hydroxylase n=1 Tax=uncultured Planktosalinus sp. TaxID=1810935 RepID=UPI0030DD7358